MLAGRLRAHAPLLCESVSQKWAKAREPPAAFAWYLVSGTPSDGVHHRGILRRRQKFARADVQASRRPFCVRLPPRRESTARGRVGALLGPRWQSLPVGADSRGPRQA
jgi:hypothetical protein